MHVSTYLLDEAYFCGIHEDLAVSKSRAGLMSSAYDYIETIMQAAFQPIDEVARCQIGQRGCADRAASQ